MGQCSHNNKTKQNATHSSIFRSVGISLKKISRISRSTFSADFELFDPWINPDEGYIPYCSVCLKDYESFKHSSDKSSVEMDHNSACLWFDYFASKIKQINQSVSFERKKLKPTKGSIR